MAQVRIIGRICLVLAMVVVQCSRSSRDSPTADKITIPLIVSTHPSNGAFDIPPGANVGIVFNVPMDTESVDHGFHLAGGPGMLQWMDALQSHRDMNGHLMRMDSMMQRLDSLQYRGSFQWSPGADTVVFIPDTQLVASQPHFIFLSGDIKGQNGRSMTMDTFGYGGYTVQFTTGP